LISTAGYVARAVSDFLLNIPLRAVIFDYFGTLSQAVRQGPAHARMARRLGCEPESWLDLMSRTFYLRAAGRLGNPLDVLYGLARILGSRPSALTLRSVRAERIAAIGADGPLRPDAVPVLVGLRERGLRTAVVSDCWYELPELLPELPVDPLLDARVFSVRVGRCKPHPALFLEACGRLGVAPAECLYVGDGGSQELTGATAVGMHAVRLDAPDLAGHLTFRPDRAFRGPTVTSLRDLLPLVCGDLGRGGGTIGA
jgi:putative hydrolase of the HAD superfamily